MGAELIEVFMASDTIVETFDVIEYFRLGLSPGAVDLLLDFFTLEIAEERFSYRVVPTVASSAHAGA